MLRFSPSSFELASTDLLIFLRIIVPGTFVNLVWFFVYGILLYADVHSSNVYFGRGGIQIYVYVEATTTDKRGRGNTGFLRHVVTGSTFEKRYSREC